MGESRRLDGRRRRARDRRALRPREPDPRQPRHDRPAVAGRTERLRDAAARWPPADGNTASPRLDEDGETIAQIETRHDERQHERSEAGVGGGLPRDELQGLPPQLAGRHVASARNGLAAAPAFRDKGPVTSRSPTEAAQAASPRRRAPTARGSTPYGQNPSFIAALEGQGVDYIATDSSKPYPVRRRPNRGARRTRPAQRGVDGRARAVPRYPTNVYYNVATREQLLDEYNYLYLPPELGGVCVNTRSHHVPLERGDMGRVRRTRSAADVHPHDGQRPAAALLPPDEPRAVENG